MKSTHKWLLYNDFVLYCYYYVREISNFMFPTMYICLYKCSVVIWLLIRCEIKTYGYNEADKICNVRLRYLCVISFIKPTEWNTREFRWIRFVLIYVIEKFPYLVTELVLDLINNCITQSDRLRRTPRKLKMTLSLFFFITHYDREREKYKFRFVRFESVQIFYHRCEIM